MIKETDLAAPVVAWLLEQHWNVYQEVEFRRWGGVADIVAERNGIMWIIESKTSYCFAVLEQAMRWPVHYRSVAVPRSRSGRDYRVARDYYQVGVIEVDCRFEPKGVYQAIEPKLFVKHRHTVKDYLRQLTELHKTFAVAGSSGGHHLTPYKQTMMTVRDVIERNPGCTIKFLYDTLGSMHYANKVSFHGNVLSALESIETWCKIDRSGKSVKLYIK